MTTSNKVYKGLMVLEEFKNLPIEGFYKIDPSLIKVLNKRFRNDDHELWKSYIQSYGYGIMYLNEFLLMISKNNNLPYKDGFLVLKSLQKLNDPVLKEIIDKIVNNSLDEQNTYVAFDRNLNDLDPIVGEAGHQALDKSIQSEDINAYHRYLSKAGTNRTKINEVYGKILNLGNNQNNSCTFLGEVQNRLDDLINKNVTMKELYNTYVTEKQPNAEQLHFDLIIDGIDESFKESNLNEFYSNIDEFVADHGINNFVTSAEKKWAISKTAGDDSFKVQCINNIFDEIFCNDLSSLRGKKIYRTKDEFMVSNYIEAIDNAVEMGFITNDEWGLSFLKDTLQQCFAMI